MIFKSLALFLAAGVSIAASHKKNPPLPPTKSGEVLTVNANGVEFKLVFVEGDQFWFGKLTTNLDQVDEGGREYSYLVELSDYYIGQFEVTQAQWNAIMGSGDVSCPNCPVTGISQRKALRFVEKLSELTNMEFSLPTEYQWEFAARGGVKRETFEYAGSAAIDDVAWHRDNADGELKPVGTKAPNTLGIYDMSGNASEYCNDFYGEYKSRYLKDNGAGAVNVDPTGPAKEDAVSNKDLGFESPLIIYRGGSVVSPTRKCRVFVREEIQQASLGTTVTKIGFRVAMKK